jgi:hypothetical protein
MTKLVMYHSNILVHLKRVSHIRPTHNSSDNRGGEEVLGHMGLSARYYIQSYVDCVATRFSKNVHGGVTN